MMADVAVYVVTECEVVVEGSLSQGYQLICIYKVMYFIGNW